MDDNNDLDSMFDDQQTSQEATETAVKTVEADTAPKVEGTGEASAESDPEGKTGETPPAEETETSTEASEETVAEGGEPAKEEPQETSKPLTAEEVRSIISELREQERTSGKDIEAMEAEVISAYYPQGLSNTLVDERTGKEIKSPQDVVELSDGSMTIEEATKWLMNEQYKLDKQVSEIKQSARELAETNANFKQGTVRVLEKYQSIFDKYPQLQQKIYKNYMKTVKMDSDKDLILSAPDIEDYYADVMEPYVMAFGYQAPAQTASTDETSNKIPESKQTAADRMDVSGDGGGSKNSTDPNDPEATLNNLFGE